MEFCLTSSLVVDNCGLKYYQNQLFLKDLPSNFWKIARFPGKIKYGKLKIYCSLSFPRKNIVLWEDMCLLVMNSLYNEKGQWPVPAL